MGSEWDLEDVIFDWVKMHCLRKITYGQILDLCKIISVNYELEKKIKEPIEDIEDKEGR